MAINVADNVANIVASIGALGTASFGLVDATKVFGGGVSLFGLGFIDNLVKSFLKDKAEAARVRGTLRANWINGAPLADQKAIAKSLIKVRLSKATARVFAAAAAVDAGTLEKVAQKLESQAAMAPDESDCFGRFDLALTASLDDAYNHADQRYRNAAKLIAMAVAVVLAIAGLLVINPENLDLRDISLAVLCGLLATPLAPIAKDVASALQAGVKVAQTVVRK